MEGNWQDVSENFHQVLSDLYFNQSFNYVVGKTTHVKIDEQQVHPNFES